MTPTTQSIPDQIQDIRDAVIAAIVYTEHVAIASPKHVNNAYINKLTDLLRNIDQLAATVDHEAAWNELIRQSQDMYEWKTPQFVEEYEYGETANIPTESQIFRSLDIEDEQNYGL